MLKLRFKKNIRLLKLLILAFLPTVISAQSTEEMKKIFAQAESYFLFEEFELANQLYILLDAPDNLNLKYKIGTCYLNIPGEKEKAVPYLEEAVKSASYEANEELFKEKRAPLDAYFSLGKAYMINNDTEKGLNTFQTFNRLAGETEEKGGMANLEYIEQQIKACQNAILLKENPLIFSRKSLGQDFTLGSINENPAVSYDGNTIVYTERRGLTNVLHFSKKIRGVWQPPVEITDDLKAGEDCSSCSLNNNGTELFLYKTDNYDGVIYSSVFADGKWSPIKKLNKNINTKFYESHASISSDGEQLFFTSNREGGLGNLDIYVSEKDASGEWGPAVNLGSLVNTPFNEDTPFITKNDSVLYFSSEGHSSIGGYDNYRSDRNGKDWSIPVNIGYPVNTPDDDKFLQPAKNGMNAFYSLTTGYKKKDIFYLGFGSKEVSFEVKGKILLSDTTLAFDRNFPLYMISRPSGDTIAKGYPDEYTGSYALKAKPGAYRIVYSGFGYYSQTIDTVIYPDNPSFEIDMDITLIRDKSVRRHVAGVVYDKINLSEIPVVEQIDSSILINDLSVNDITDKVISDEDILFYTVQVIALHKPVDVSYFKYISDMKVMYNDTDKFYRYTTGAFQLRDEAYRLRLQLIGKGYPNDIFIKKVSKK